MFIQEKATQYKTADDFYFKVYKPIQDKAIKDFFELALSANGQRLSKEKTKELNKIHAKITKFNHKNALKMFNSIT